MPGERERGRRPAARSEPAEEPPPNPLESTARLLVRAQSGDQNAREKLAGRYLAALRRWAHGRLPQSARDLVDTDDIVQSALYRAFSRIERFEDRGSGAFLAYLRQIVLNQIRDEARRARRRPAHEGLPEDLSRDDPSPLENLIGREKLMIYEREMNHLPPTQREAMIMRLELGLRYREIAEAMGLVSGNAARMLIARGIVRLSEGMRDLT